MIVKWLRALWQGFVGLFGLNSCQAPTGQALDAKARATRDRLEQRLRRG